MSFCEVCGQAACKDPMEHLDDDILMSVLMEHEMHHPYCYCPVWT